MTMANGPLEAATEVSGLAGLVAKRRRHAASTFSASVRTFGASPCRRVSMRGASSAAQDGGARVAQYRDPDGLAMSVGEGDNS